MYSKTLNEKDQTPKIQQVTNPEHNQERYDLLFQVALAPERPELVPEEAVDQPQRIPACIRQSIIHTDEILQDKYSTVSDDGVQNTNENKSDTFQKVSGQPAVKFASHVAHVVGY